MKFELKKLLAQKKLVWFLMIIVLVTSAMLWQNLSQQDGMVNRALDEVEPLVDAVAAQQRPLQDLLENSALNEQQQQHYNRLQQMRMALTRWRNAVNQKDWGLVPQLQADFLAQLQLYTEVGGEFTVLDGLDREIAIAKADWLIEHYLPYEDETFPITPHLMLKQTTGIFLGIIGIAILLLFLGNSITEEKEQYTWLTLRTQPLTKLNLISAKYCSLLTMVLAYIVLVLGVGLLLPKVWGGVALSFQYPQVLASGDTFMLISTGEYLIRSVILFICASTVTLAISLFISTWVRKSFSAYLLMAAVLGIGFFSTGSIPSPLNPFYLLNFAQILGDYVPGTDWLYPLSACLWSVILLLVSANLSDQQFSIGPELNTGKPFAGGRTKGTLALLSIWIFEGRKLRREGLLKQLSVFLVIAIVVGIFALHQQAQQKKEEYFQKLNENAQYVQQILEEGFRARLAEFQAEEAILQEVGIENYDNPEMARYLVFDSFDFQIEHLQLGINHGQQRLDKLLAAQEAYEQGDWATFYDYQLLINRFENQELTDTGGWIAVLAQHAGKFTTEVSVAERLWLIEHDIQPVFPGEYLPTIYNNWTSETYNSWGREWEEDNTKIDSNGLFALYLAFENYLYLLPMALLLFLLGGGMALEKGKRETLKMLKTQPITEKQIFTGKVLNSIMTVVVACFILALLLVLMGTVVNRFGDWRYPIIHYNSTTAMGSPDYTGMIADRKGYHFITLGKYLVDGMTLFLSLSLFFISLSNFISLFFKKPLGVFVTTVLTGGGGYWLTENAVANNHHIVPFTYFNISKIVNGEIATYLDNPGINASMGTIVLLLSSLVLLAAGYVWLSKGSINLPIGGGEKHDLSS